MSSSNNRISHLTSHLLPTTTTTQPNHHLTNNHTTNTIAPPKFITTLICGAGFSGLLLGLELKERQRQDFIIIDRQDKVGGTWAANRYYGVECDVRALAYLPLQRVPGFIPSKRYSTGHEIQQFTEKLVQIHDLKSHLYLSTTLTSAKWISSENLWIITMINNNHEWTILKCKFLIFANGPLSNGSMTSVKNCGQMFKGKQLLHTSNWPQQNNQVNVKDLTVGVIGTGASAIQLIPNLHSQQPKKMYIFQRTAPYVFPKSEDNFKPPQPILPSDFIFRKRAETNWAQDNIAFKAYHEDMKMNKKWQQVFQQYLHSIVKDPKLRQILTPNEPVGAKRPLLMNGYYETLIQSNVQIITEGVESEMSHGVKTVSGKEFNDIDVLIYATGFDVSARGYFHGIDIQGEDGQSISNRVSSQITTPGQNQISNNGWTSLYGLVTHGFPNMFILLGPHGFIYHANAMETIEVQTEYVASLIDFTIQSQLNKVTVTEKDCMEHCMLLKELGEKSIYRTSSGNGNVMITPSWYNQGGKEIMGVADRQSSYTKRLIDDGFSKFVFYDHNNQLVRNAGVGQAVPFKPGRLPSSYKPSKNPAGLSDDD
jgi:cation diffusion facilitator CzcD-associated flavoprotein CzcO